MATSPQVKVKFVGGAFDNLSGFQFQEISATQEITRPFIWEFSVRGLAKAYNYGQIVFLGNRQQVIQVIKAANADRESTIAMVAKYLTLPISEQLSDYTNKLYDPSFYKNTDMEAAINALDSGYAIQNIFLQSKLQQVQDYFKSQLASHGWQVQYFNIDQIITVNVNGPGGDIPSTYIDGATWLVSAVPNANAKPLQFMTNSNNYENRYGDLPMVAFIIIVTITGALLIMWQLQNLTVVVGKAMEQGINALGKNAPAVVSSLAIGGAVVVGTVLAIMLVIGYFTSKSKKTSGGT
jgi:hypothetical protein